MVSPEPPDRLRRLSYALVGLYVPERPYAPERLSYAPERPSYAPERPSCAPERPSCASVRLRKLEVV